MIEVQDIQDFTKRKQDLQVAAEILFRKMVADGFNLAAFLADPDGYTEAFLGNASAEVLRLLLPESYRLGQNLAAKAAGK